MITEPLPVRNRTNVGSSPFGLAIVILLVMIVGIGLDVIGDYRSGSTLWHVGLELTSMPLAIWGVATLWRRLRIEKHRSAKLSTDVEAAQQEAQRFKEEAGHAIQGLSEAIDRQFSRWQLTSAEREVALLLLKGLTHREIAAIRTTRETTIRQQALSVYRKSGVTSRTELSAFFLEDLLMPTAQRK